MANTPRVGTPLPGTPLPGTPFAAAPSAQLASYEARQAVAASAGDGAHRVTFDDEGAVGGAATASRAWQPIPVPVPTYVTAPKAPRRGRQIEVPPSWSDGLRDDDVEIDLAGLERIEPDLDRMLERRRAVND